MSDITEILRDLAAGRIDAAEAGRLIEAAKQTTPNPTVQAEATTEVVDGEVVDSELVEEVPEPARPSDGVQRVSVRAVGRRVRIVGDPSVSTLSATGPHELRRAGSTLEVTSDGELGPSLDAFNFIKAPRGLDDLRALGLGKELILRVNPALGLDIEVTAGTLTTTGVPVLGKVRVTASGANLNGVTRVDDALVQAATASVRGRLRAGRSRVRVESGQLTVELDAASDVAVHGEAQMGRITWPGDHGALDEFVLGDGTARLDVGVVMGYATVRVMPETAAGTTGSTTQGAAR